MPTGYTAAIQDGITFNEYIMNCARAFGACISMRDDPSSMPIPEQIEAPTYHSGKIEESENRLKELKSLTTSQTEIEAQKEYEEKLKAKEDQIRKAIKIKNQYMAMIRQAQEWEPPSNDHVELKDFMIDQINRSMSDCDTSYYKNKNIEFLTGEEWKQKEIDGCLTDIEYHTIEHNKELERISQRNKWIKQLRESLK